MMSLSSTLTPIFFLPIGLDVLRAFNSAGFAASRYFEQAHRREHIPVDEEEENLANQRQQLTRKVELIFGAVIAQTLVFSTVFSRFRAGLKSHALLASFAVLPILRAAQKSSVVKKEAWQDNFAHLSHHRHLAQDVANPWYEKLVKIMINDPIPIGSILSVTTSRGNEEYRVHRKFSDKGLVAYALVPASEDSSLLPLIAFRATEPNLLKESAFASIQNDLDPTIGERGYASNAKGLQELMNDPSFRKEGEKIKILGYSLGGIHAQYFAADHFPHIQHIVLFNAPNAPNRIAEAFAKKVKTHDRKEDPLILQIYRTVGDPTHYFGGKHIGCGVESHDNLKIQLLEIEYPGQFGFDLRLHSKRFFDTTDYNYKVTEIIHSGVLSKLLDNATRNPIARSLEKLRLSGGRLIGMGLNGLESAASTIKRLFNQILPCLKFQI